jgi:hypothetical protein
MMNTMFSDELFREIAELMVKGFIGWMSLQLEAEKMLTAFDCLMKALYEERPQPLSHLEFQDAYDAACWLSSVACGNGFEEMGDVFDMAANQLSRMVSSFGYSA